MAFGIIAHNSSEWNILLRLYYGKTAHVRNTTNLCLIVYFIIMLLAMSLLPLELLLFFSMVQGGFLDWSFVWFIIAARKTIQGSDAHEKAPDQCCNSQYSTFAVWFGIGAITHLLSVEILFAGFILNNATLVGGGGFLLVPMFFFYTMWVFGQARLMIFCGPQVFMNYVTGGVPESLQKFFIVPYTHTTRAVDVLWKRFVGEGYAPVKADDVELTGMSGGPEKPVDGDKSENSIIGFSTGGAFEVEDCESFKFGIIDDVRKCPECHCCKSDCCNTKCRIPCYWILAFICIFLNSAILINLPMWVSPSKRNHRCNAGFDYGAW